VGEKGIFGGDIIGDLYSSDSSDSEHDEVSGIKDGTGAVPQVSLNAVSK